MTLAMSNAALHLQVSHPCTTAFKSIFQSSFQISIPVLKVLLISASFIDGSFAETAGINTLFPQLLTFLHSACIPCSLSVYLS